MIWLIDGIIVIVVIVVMFYPRIRLRMVAKVLDNEEFNRKISENGQLIDVRESKEFRKKHIMGARNLPSNQIEQSLGAISKNRPVLLYENGRPQLTTRVAGKLKKAGITEVYILKTGLVKWGGKVKE